MEKSQWTQSMKLLSRKLSEYLPKKHLYSPSNPILFMSDGKNLRFLYSYDQIKKVAYTSDSSMEKYDYMSICEIYYEGWGIIDREKAYNMLVPISFEMPF